MRIASAGVDCVQFVFIVGIRLSECYAGFCKFFSMAKSTFSGSCSCLMLVSDCDSVRNSSVYKGFRNCSVSDEYVL